MPQKLEQLGLVPDAHGDVAPAAWVGRWEQASAGKFSAEDRLDFHLVAEECWALPFYTDGVLLDSIDMDNITWMRLYVDEGAPLPILLSMWQIRLDDAIRVMAGTGTTAMEIVSDGKHYTITLDGDVDTYQNAIITYDGQVVATVKLR